MLRALAAICSETAAISSILVIMSSTEQPIFSNASRVCSTTVAPSSVRLAPSSTTSTA